MSIQLDFLLGRSRSTRIRNGPSSLPPLGRSRSTRSSAGHKSHLDRPGGGQISSLDRSSVDGHQKDQQSSGYSTIKDQLNEYDSLMDQPSGQNSQLKRSSGHDKSSLWLGRSRSARSGSDGVTMLNHSTIKYLNLSNINSSFSSEKWQVIEKTKKDQQNHSVVWKRLCKHFLKICTNLSTQPVIILRVLLKLSSINRY